MSSVGTPTISRTGRLPGSGVASPANRTPMRRHRGGLPGGCCRARRRRRRPCAAAAVQGQPAGYAVGADGLHFVAHRDVGVQVGVAGAGVAVVERGGDQPGGVDLGDAVGAHAGEGGVVFEEGDGVGDGVVVAVLDGAGLERGAIAHSADTDLTG